MQGKSPPSARPGLRIHRSYEVHYQGFGLQSREREQKGSSIALNGKEIFGERSFEFGRKINMSNGEVQTVFKYGLLHGMDCDLLIPLSVKPSGKSLKSNCILLS